jgi:hypothetical protein
MKNYLTKRIHFSGFPKPDKENLIKQSKSLGFSIDEELTGSTSYLVCKSILIEKYRIAKILEIKVIKGEWITESFQRKSILPAEDYQFAIFENLRFFLLGFEDKQAIEIAKKIVASKGEMFCPAGTK